MPEALVREEAAALFFRDQLITAMDRQKVATSASTESYLVHMLTGFARGDRLPGREPGFGETPLAGRALPAVRRRSWRSRASPRSPRPGARGTDGGATLEAG